ncbi:MAG: transporter substrate-binding domain-containing protein [Rhodospirillaceae bacterium]|nr:transporter substrate-binding domain-containing protein [Rhodospirillaceae bacterium]
MLRHLVGAAAGALAAMALLVPSAGAADTLDRIKQDKYITLGSYNEPPHNWVEPSGGGYRGIDYEIAAAILKTLGIETIYEIPVDWAGLIPGLQAGRWDMLAVGMSITPERAEQVGFTKPIYRYGSALIVPQGNPKGIRGLDDFPGHKVGAILGGTDADLIKSVEGAELVAYKTHPEMINDLKAGRIDAALAGETTAAYANVEHPEPAIELLHEWQGKASRPTGFAFRKGDTRLREYFEAQLDAMKKDGSLAAILEKYGLSAGNIVP